MTNEEITIGNRIISKFMGLSIVYTNDEKTKCEYTTQEPWPPKTTKVKFDKPRDDDYIYRNVIEYHLSWDWLIPVYSKIMNTEFSSANTEEFELQSLFEETVWNNRIDLAFDAIVNYIKNEQK
jgi:hypothetical protein